VRLGVVDIQPRIVDEVVLFPLAVEPLRLVLGFEDFYARARPEVVRALALTLGDVDLATQATDEALTRAYMRWPSVRGRLPASDGDDRRSPRRRHRRTQTSFPSTEPRARRPISVPSCAKRSVGRPSS
jgi:hypothetical protein